MTVINTNISSLIGMNNLRLTNLGLQTSLARLSSGLRINWAADDPSGLAIAKGMEAQIGGIRTAVQNAEDGINLIRTADGSLAATHEILLRMRDLAVRAANEATLTSADMTRLDDEFQSLVAEIDRKADAVTFNTKNLFNGDYAAGQVLQIGADNAGTYQLTVTIQ
ncbi:MAG TPA: flagellin, partial [bacterium]|nr:flagellin [bacterium]